MNGPVLPPPFDALPPDIRDQLQGIKQSGHGVFGRRQVQQIVDEHFGVFVRLRDDFDATHADLAALLGQLGITSPNGQLLTAGTVSSAISRALAKFGSLHGKRRRTASRSRKSVRRGPSGPAAAPAVSQTKHLPSAAAGPLAALNFAHPTGLETVDPAWPSPREPPRSIAPTDHRDILLDLLEQSPET